MEITTEPLTATGFSAFGEVIEHEGDQRRIDFSVPFQRTSMHTTPALWVNSLKTHQASSLRVEILERHLYSAQTFIPLGPSRCLVVVALSGAHRKPDLGSMRAFVTLGGQGISYRPSVWHHALMFARWWL
jgi:ureidoglycolate lyase